MFRPEPLDLLLVALVAILIFGANRLPELARALGKAIRGFKEELVSKDNGAPKT